MAEHVEALSGDEADLEDDINGDEGCDEGQDEKKKNIAGMLDVIGKILSKKVKENEKGVILSKYKEGKKRQLEKEEEEAAKRARSITKAEFREKNHVIPDRSNADKEVSLRKIGTRGVVKLFNAVAKHQKEVESKLKTAATEVKKDKVIESMSKTSFLDMLKTNTAKKQSTLMSAKQESITNEKQETPSWNILRDDFMMGSKMKDWDKNIDNASDDDDDEDADALESSDSAAAVESSDEESS